jgi:hypothetical protein
LLAQEDQQHKSRTHGTDEHLGEEDAGRCHILFRREFPAKPPEPYIRIVSPENSNGCPLLRRDGAGLAFLSHMEHIEAQTCFLQALDMARRQQATSLELRAVLRLSQLWQRQGKGAAARRL